MSVAYFDCFAGAAGDMIVASLLDAGASFDALQAQLATLKLDPYQIRAEPVRRRGVGGLQFHVDVPGHHGTEDAGQAHGEHHHRHFGEILEIIAQAGLPPRVVDRATRIFKTLGEAEAKVHRIPIEEVHFHEVGAVDSIVDIVGACIALELLNIDEIYCSAIPTGSGTVQCEHGLLPVPPPATAEMLRHVPLAATPIVGEATTPTAAAILTTLAKSFGPLPAMDIAAVGYGAGSREGDVLPNLLRVFVGKLGDQAQQLVGVGAAADTVVELSANIDDCTGEVLGATIARLMAASCLDAWATPIYMKKNRPAWMLTVLCLPADAEAAEGIIFAETTTFGVRRGLCTRSKLLRRHETVETPFGPIRIKIGERDGKIVTAAPEFADCSAAADSHHAAVRDVIEAAILCFRTGKQ